MQNTTGLEGKKIEQAGGRTRSTIRAWLGSGAAALLLWLLFSTVAMVDASGEPILDWAFNTRYSPAQQTQQVTMDRAGNIVVAGLFSGTATFGHGPDELTLTTEHTHGVFLVRYRSDGSPEWAVGAGGPGINSVRGIAADADGNIVLTGTFRDAIAFGGGSGAVNLVSGGSDDLFVTRYRSDSTLDWAIRAGGPDFIEPGGIAVNETGGVVLTGRFSGSATFGSDSNAVTLTSESPGVWGSSEMFLARYRSDGTLVGATTAQSNGRSSGAAVSVHTDGSILVTGSFSSGFANIAAIITLGTGNEAVTLTPSGSRGAFLARFSENGSLVWAKGSTGTAQVNLASIAVSAEGHIFVGGWMSFGDATFSDITIDKPYYLEPTYCGRDASMLLLRYSPDGDVDWAVTNEPGPRYYEGSEYSCDWLLPPSQAYVRDITLTSDGDPLLAGSFYGQVVFGEGDEALILTSPSDGWGYSAFLARYRADGKLDWLTTPAHGDSNSDGSHVASDAADNIVFGGGFNGTITLGSGDNAVSLVASSPDWGQFLARFKPQSDVRTLACIGFESPADRDLLVRRPNRVIPLSITLLEENRFVTGGDIAPPLVNRVYQGAGDQSSGELEELDYRGQGSDGNQFEADGSSWVFNLSTSGFSKGTHSVTVGSGDSNQYVVEPTCRVQVVFQ
jgi:hypothetical protein